ncbi:MAG: 23S rRNA (uracil(1939)-C(5))-methyltransferase RlmD [Clostridium sp.]|nr:23S rRNA (uracil(1939)-C(5))-methyltransferase RlmD [Clostridium sp.]
MYQKNELLTVTITDIGSGGEGIGKCDGYTLFVKDAVMGDVVRARITKPKKNYAYARVEEIITSSPFRVTPPCPVYRQCGGCQLQPLSYEQQLRYKERKVRGNLQRIGGFDGTLLDKVMEPIVGMDEPYRYRNKAQYPFGITREGNSVTGFYAGRTHTIIPGTDCLLGAAENREILEAVLAYMKENHVKAYDETSGNGLIRHVLIRKGVSTQQLMVCVVINGRELPQAERLAERLRKIPNMTSVSYCINTENTNVIMGTEVVLLWGTPYIMDSIRMYREDLREFDGREVTFTISPLSFYQVNPRQTEKLYSLALAYAGLTGKETVWDLYCGIGTISLFLAGDAKRVYGVEVVPQAIEDARENARRNGIENAVFFVGKAEEVLPRFYESGGCAGGADEDVENSCDMRHPDVIVVDPPRKGCDEACLQTMLAMAPERIVYVSCDSATLARDLRILADGGYELTRVRAADMFPQTVHVEVAVLLCRADT